MPCRPATPILSSQRKKPRGRPRQVALESAPAKALDKGLSALRRIAESDGISLNDLSLDLDMPLATLHRLLLTLESHGFVRQSKSDTTWSIGIEAFRVGSAFPRGESVRWAVACGSANAMSFDPGAVTKSQVNKLLKKVDVRSIL